MRTALLLIDFQRDFLADDGRMRVAASQVSQVIAAANRAVAEARRHGTPIVAIGNEFPAHDWLMNVLRRNAALAGSSGARWDSRIDIDDATYFSKSRGDAFSNERFAQYLAERGVEEIVLTGLFATACVTATVRGALSRGLRVRLLEPAIADSSDRAKSNALRKLGKLSGVVVESG